MDRQSIFERVMREYRVVIAIILAAVAYGIIAFLTMPRQEFPEFTVRQGLVMGVMPGADAHQVEERLTRPLEQHLFSYKEVNKAKTYSMSQDGRAIVIVELNENVRGLEAPAFWAKLRHGLNELKAQSLPSQVVALVGSNDFGDTSALLLTIVFRWAQSPRCRKAIACFRRPLATNSGDVQGAALRRTTGGHPRDNRRASARSLRD